MLVFLHGGGNTQGSSSEPTYEGTALVNRGAVVVTLNYRLGALGFFANPALDSESDAGVSGNYGVLDQQLALRWVRDNVGRFGGDASRVLVFGESAGGVDTIVHLVAPGSQGLFSSALVESGGIYKPTLAEAEVQDQSVVTGAGCGGAADLVGCLRSAQAETLVRVPSEVGPLSPGLHYAPVIDGVVIPANPLELVKQGRHHHVPVVIGSNADETSRQVPPVKTSAEYEAAIRAMYSPVATELLAHYPADTFGTPRETLVRVTTDITWTCSVRRLARALAANQTQPVFRYFFTWRPPGAVGAVVGASHAIEIPFVFRTFAAVGFTPDATALGLSEAIEGYWTRLAATGDPNQPAAVAWPQYPASGDPALELGATMRPLTSVRTSDCDFIDSLIP